MINYRLPTKFKVKTYTKDKYVSTQHNQPQIKLLFVWKIKKFRYF